MTSKRMTRAEMIQWLGNAIRTETEKPFDEIDYGFVDECGRLLDELMGKSVVLSETEIEERLVKLRADISASSASKGFKIKYRKRWKIAVVCAAVILGCSGITVAGFNPSFMNMLVQVIEMDSGSSITEGNVTFIHAGESITYTDIETLVRAENLDILYPHNLSTGFGINEISYVEKQQKIIISFGNVPNNYISIEIDQANKLMSEYIKEGQYSESQIGEKTVYIPFYSACTAFFINDNDLYSIKAENETQLKLIIESLE